MNIFVVNEQTQLDIINIDDGRNCITKQTKTISGVFNEARESINYIRI